jgi:hypothetical protein
MLNLPEHLVQSVIVHTFHYVKRWVGSPMYKARLVVPELGSFCLNKHKITKDLERMLSILKSKNISEEMRHNVEISFRRV